MSNNDFVTQVQILNLVRSLENELARGFVGREEEARVAVLALLTKQHAVFIGPPGTAKSALIHRLSQLVQCRYFYYLLSKYTVPDELIGVIDPIQYKNGKFVRNTQGKLPQAELAFIDEVFKGSSETLNCLLNVMNERIFVDSDGSVYKCSLHSLFGASNETPYDDELAAFYDRFLIRHFVKPIDATRLEEAIIHNITNLNTNVKPICTLQEISKIYDEVSQYMAQNAGAIAKAASQLVIILRQHGISISDRTATSQQHLSRLIATYACVYQTDLKKSALAVSKYILPNEEASENYKKALDALMPVEIREATEKLEKARNYAVDGDLKEAKRNAAEAIQIAQALFSKPEKVELFKYEIREIISSAEKLVGEISDIEEKLKQFKRRD
ncbi:MAG: AAA family ATPase [Candidatus Bathyarchaeia archaeon]